MTSWWEQNHWVEATWWLEHDSGESHVSVDGEVAYDQLLFVMVSGVVRIQHAPSHAVTFLHHLLSYS